MTAAGAAAAATSAAWNMPSGGASGVQSAKRVRKEVLGRDDLARRADALVGPAAPRVLEELGIHVAQRNEAALLQGREEGRFDGVAHVPLAREAVIAPPEVGHAQSHLAPHDLRARPVRLVELFGLLPPPPTAADPPAARIDRVCSRAEPIGEHHVRPARAEIRAQRIPQALRRRLVHRAITAGAGAQRRLHIPGRASHPPGP